MANGISKNPLNDISKVYLNQIAEGSLKSLEKASVLAMSDKPEDQDKAREIKTRFDYQSLMKQKKAKKGKVMEARSDWRHDLREIIVTPDKDSKEPQIKEKKIKNKIQVNPEFKEAVEELGGRLLTVEEVEQDDKKAEQMKKKEKMLKKRMLMMKLRAVQQTGGEDVVAGYEPEGEQIDEIQMPKNTKYARMSYKKLKKTHKDFKNMESKPPRVTVLDKDTNKTVSRPVKFVPEAKVDQGKDDAAKINTRNQRAFGNRRGSKGGGHTGDDMEARRYNTEKGRGVKMRGKKDKTPVNYRKRDSDKAIDELLGRTKKKEPTYLEKKGRTVAIKRRMKEEVVTELNRFEKEKGVDTKTGKPVVKGGTAKNDKAFQAVAKKYASQMMGGPQKKKVRGQKPDESNTPFKRAAARIKQTKMDNKALADKAKKAGYKSTQDYVNVQAVRKGGLGT